MKFIKLLLLLLLFLFSFSCEQNTKIAPTVVDGVLNLSNWDFQKDGNIKLDGDWEFYWEQLLEPKDFHTNRNPEYIYVPQGWSGQKEDSKKHPESGYATYRLIIILPKITTQYRLLFNRLFSATKVYMNGDLLTKAGELGKTKATSRMSNMNFDDYFSKAIYPTEGEMELIVQVSNFETNGMYAGLISTIYIGTKQDIKSKDNLIVLPAFLVVGMLFIIGIYHLILFFYRKNDYSTLVFSLLSLVFVIRIFQEKNLISRFLIEQTALDIKLARAIIYTYILLMPIFFYLLFKKYFQI